MFKFFILLLFSSSVYALTLQQELKNLAPDGDMQLYMNECGYKDASMHRFKDRMIKQNDWVKLDALKGCKVQVAADSKVQSDKMTILKNLKELEWSVLTDGQKNKVIKYLMRNIK